MRTQVSPSQGVSSSRAARRGRAQPAAWAGLSTSASSSAASRRLGHPPPPSSPPKSTRTVTSSARSGAEPWTRSRSRVSTSRRRPRNSVSSQASSGAGFSPSQPTPCRGPATGRSRLPSTRAAGRAPGGRATWSWRRGWGSEQPSTSTIQVPEAVAPRSRSAGRSTNSRPVPSSRDTSTSEGRAVAGKGAPSSRISRISKVGMARPGPVMARTRLLLSTSPRVRGRGRLRTSCRAARKSQGPMHTPLMVVGQNCSSAITGRWSEPPRRNTCAPKLRTFRE